MCVDVLAGIMYLNSNQRGDQRSSAGNTDIEPATHKTVKVRHIGRIEHIFCVNDRENALSKSTSCQADSSDPEYLAQSPDKQQIMALFSDARTSNTQCFDTHPVTCHKNRNLRNAVVK
jgi:hypothetical protein